MNAPTPDENFSDETQNNEAEFSTAPAAMSAFVPLTLMCISFILVMFWQVRGASKQCDALTQGIQQNQGQVAEAQQLQAGYWKIVKDLFEVAKDDDAAKIILLNNDIRDPQTGRPLVSVSNNSSAAGSK